MKEKRPAQPTRSTLPAAGLATIVAASTNLLSPPVPAPAQTTAPAQNPAAPSSRAAQAAPAVDPALVQKLAQLGKRERRVHDPSTIVKCKDEYWMFATGRGAPSFHSKDMKTWEPGPPVITERPEW